MTEQTGSVEMDLDAMMDVVAMYKCKFCAHTTEMQDAMKKHLQQHVIANNTQQFSKALPDSAIVVQNDTLSSTSQVITHIDQGLFENADVTNTETNLSEDILAANSQTLLLEELSNPDHPMITTLSSQTDSQTGTIDTLAKVNAVVATKEFFLCGQCNAGFDSMEDCKVHIEQDHQLLASVDDLGETTFIYDTKPSVGTQADNVKTGKTRGRGKKHGIEDEKHFDEELAKELYDDDDYKISLSGKRRVGKRQTKPPKSLLCEYVVGMKNDSDTDEEQIDDGESQEDKADAVPEQKGAGVGVIVLSTSGTDPKDDASPRKRRKLNNEEDKDASYIPSETEEKEAIEEENEDSKLNESVEKEGSDLDQESGINNKANLNEDGVVVQKEQHTNTDEPVKPPDSSKKKRRKLTHSGFVEKVPRMKAKYTCLKKFCKGKFFRKSSYETHQLCHSKRGGLVCYMCNEKFTFWPKCSLHLWKYHQIDLDLYRCEICEFRTTLACKLSIHKAIHSDVRPYVCKVCNRGFKQASQLINHEALHGNLGENFESWLASKCCKLCKDTFASEKSLRTHINVVHGRSNFGCPSCEYFATSKTALLTHLRTHTGEKPFKCDFCDFACADYNTLRRHRMRHTGDKPYICPDCDYSCIQSTSLKSHIRTKHGRGATGLWFCQLCNFRTVSEKRWFRHCSEHKGSTIVEVKKNVGGASPSKVAQRFILPKNTQIKCTRCDFSTIDPTAMLSHIASADHSLQQSVDIIDSQQIVSNQNSADDVTNNSSQAPSTSEASSPSVLPQPVESQVFKGRELASSSGIKDTTIKSLSTKTIFAKKLPSGRLIVQSNPDRCKTIDLNRLKNPQVVRIGTSPNTQSQQKQNTSLKVAKSDGISPVINITPVSDLSQEPSLKSIFDDSVVKTESIVIETSAIQRDQTENSSQNDRNEDSIKPNIAIQNVLSQNVDESRVQVVGESSNEYVYSVNEDGKYVIAVPYDSETLLLTEENLSSESSQNLVITEEDNLTSISQPFTISEAQVSTEGTSVFTEEAIGEESFVFTETGSNETTSFMRTDDGKLKPVQIRSMPDGQLIITSIGGMDIGENLQVVDLEPQEEEIIE